MSYELSYIIYPFDTNFQLLNFFFNFYFKKIFIYLFIYLFIYWAALGLSCGMQDLLLRHEGSSSLTRD